MVKVAIITGGASGIGEATVKALLAHDEAWQVHILDFNAENGEKFASSSERILFHEVDVSKYDSIKNAFEKIFKLNERLDFVYANAGILGALNFYERHDGVEAPPPWNHSVLDINLCGVINTTYLALHYFRQNKQPVDANIVMTASCVSMYPAYVVPLYTASKYGILGFMRAVAGYSYREKVRVNAVCPGVVATNLNGPGGTASVPPEVFTPVENIAKAVLTLLDGKAATDSAGRHKVNGLNGITLEVSKDNFYFREQPDYCDETMRKLMSDPVTTDEVPAGDN